MEIKLIKNDNSIIKFKHNSITNIIMLFFIDEYDNLLNLKTLGYVTR